MFTLYFRCVTRYNVQICIDKNHEIPKGNDKRTTLLLCPIIEQCIRYVKKKIQIDKYISKQTFRTGLVIEKK